MKVSVAICTYNGEHFLKEQLDSILKQTRAVDEIIICDDQSTDRTISILDEYQKKHPELIKVFVNDENLRSVKNFEKAIQLCSGAVIFLSDQDDIWVHDKVENYLNHFERNPNLSVLSSDGYCIDEHSKKHEKYAIWQVPSFFEELGHGFDYYKSITHIANIATGASMALRREVLADVLPFPLVSKFHHDEWIARITASKNQFALLPGKYFCYRTHQNQQVGGVFYPKTEEQKSMLLARFDLARQPENFKAALGRRKDLFRSYNKTKKLIALNTRFNELFLQDIQEQKKLIAENDSFLKKNYPVRAGLNAAYEYLFKKRQF